MMLQHQTASPLTSPPPSRRVAVLLAALITTVLLLLHGVVRLRGGGVELAPASLAAWRGVAANLSAPCSAITGRTAYVCILFGQGSVVVEPVRVWAHALRRLPCFKSELLALVLEGTQLSQHETQQLHALGVRLVPVAPLANPFAERSIAAFPRRGKQWATRVQLTMMKLRAWQLTEYDALILMDTDIVLVRDVNWLMAVPGLAALPWRQNPRPTQLDFFPATQDTPLVNIGIIAVHPDERTFAGMLAAMEEYAALSCGRDFDDVITLDQGFLNFYFRAALVLLPQTFLNSGPGFDDPLFVDAECELHPYVSGYHFAGGRKPWNTSLSWGGEREEFQALRREDVAAALPGCALRGHRRWWELYHDMAHDVAS